MKPPVSTKSPAPGKAARAGKGLQVASAAVKPAPKPQRGIFAEKAFGFDGVANEEIERSHNQRMLKLVFSQTIVIVILTTVLILMTPFTRPIYHYYAVDDATRTPRSMVGLTMPNMTNTAVLSWSVTSVTAIMTVGFGDFEQKLNSQKNRFTPKGWESFVNAFYKQEIGQSFKEHQLVLTTVPSNTPVIVSQGINEDKAYQWEVQLPIVMTYATNNNVTRRDHQIAKLKIVRVPTLQNPAGIAIKDWRVEKGQ